MSFIQRRDYVGRNLPPAPPQGPWSRGRSFAALLRHRAGLPFDRPLPAPTTRLEKIADELIALACGGDQRAIRTVMEHVDGRPPVAVHHIDDRAEGPAVDPDRQRRVLDDSGYRAKLLELEDYGDDDAGPGAGDEPGGVRPGRVGGPMAAEAPPEAAQ